MRDVPNHIALRFVAPFEERIKHMMELKNIETEKATQLLLEKSDKRKVALSTI